jgi:hypothetical protein
MSVQEPDTLLELAGLIGEAMRVNPAVAERMAASLSTQQLDGLDQEYQEQERREDRQLSDHYLGKGNQS